LKCGLQDSLLAEYEEVNSFHITQLLALVAELLAFWFVQTL
jgi:hypothetical protein